MKNGLFKNALDDIVQRINEIYKKYSDDYFSFSVSGGVDTRNGKEKFKWNFYTPTLSHRYFNTKDKFIKYLDEIIGMEPQEYKDKKYNELLEERGRTKEYLESLDDEIELVEQYRNEK